MQANTRMRPGLKLFLCSAFFLLTVHVTSHSQTDVLTAVVHDDTVTIWNNNVYYPCAASFALTASQYLQTITIIEQDTSSMLATCMCYYQMSVDIAGLSAGEYEVVVFRRFRIYIGDGATRDTMFIVGRLHVTIAAQAGQFAFRGYQSPCLPFASVPTFGTETAESFGLEDAYPNPFNGTTRIRVRLQHRMDLRLDVYDIAGREVARLGEGTHEPGFYTYVWDPAGLPSGIYMVRARTRTGSVSTKVVFLK